MKKVKELSITWEGDLFNIDGEEFKGIPATKEELEILEKSGMSSKEPCGQQICHEGWVWVLIDSPSGNGCQWFKTNARCNE
ncbi:hypothetical protein A1704_23450 [Chryseobacterium cucumeris]|uniref:hypothetical protein n=1 Tax=Chryseobacterium cucumeris TaxID=1813611 RepID=UPI0007879047|nr:hypothetical protein [Chryseobacterium cucumeris]KYH06639.1 hypothetical protein A1704_23450 [Chryseobacterium cucumeris]